MFFIRTENTVGARSAQVRSWHATVFKTPYIKGGCPEWHLLKPISVENSSTVALLSSKRTFPSRGIETVGRGSELAREQWNSRASSLPQSAIASEGSSRGAASGIAGKPAPTK